MDAKLELLKLIAESAQATNTRALGLFAGSVATILGASYLSPSRMRFRLTYLLFIPAWALLGWAFRHGDLIHRRYIAARASPSDENIFTIFTKMNDDYMVQQDTFLAAVVLLSVWLMAYLVWWVWLHGREQTQ